MGDEQAGLGEVLLQHVPDPARQAIEVEGGRRKRRRLPWFLDQCNHLEILEPSRTGAENETLLGVMDDTLTPMGGRLLSQWLRQPLIDHGGNGVV